MAKKLTALPSKLTGQYIYLSGTCVMVTGRQINRSALPGRHIAEQNNVAALLSKVTGPQNNLTEQHRNLTGRPGKWFCLFKKDGNNVLYSARHKKALPPTGAQKIYP